MHHLRLIACVMFCLFGPAAQAIADSLTIDGTARSYTITRATTVAPAPILIVLHGGRGTAAQMQRYIGIDAMATAAGAHVIYPQARDNRWGDGRIGADGAPLVATDDVAFLDLLITTLVDAGIADPDAVFITGISNGGMMALRMACASPQPIAGIAVVAANLPVGLDCPRLRPLKILHFMGVDDPILPDAGGAIAGWGDLGSVASSAQTFDRFLQANGCTGATEQPLPDQDADDGTRVTLREGQGCAVGPAPRQFHIMGGGHTWPGAAPHLRRLLGLTSQEISASATIIAAFFQ
jgi:polyhydroxybutyrate depolymerase